MNYLNKLLFYTILLILAVIGCNKDNDIRDTVDNEQFYNPYSNFSAFNRPIGNGAIYSDTYSELTTDIQLKDWSINTKNGWSFAVTTSDETDVLVAITKFDPNRGQNLPYQLRIPDGFPVSVGVPETSDCQVVIYDKTKGTTHEFYKFKWNNGSPTALIHRTDDPDVANNPAMPTNIKIDPEQNVFTGKGHASEGSGNLVGTRASGTAGLAGLIRDSELTDPNTEMYPKHALALELSYDQLSKQKQWPASGMDSDVSGNTGSINYGALVAIPPVEKGGPAFDSLGLTDAGMRLAKSLVFYGAYVVDRRGTTAGLEGDQNVPYNAKMDAQNDFNTILKQYLRVLINNDSNQDCSGGGTPIDD